jgi:hypothetical protein
MHNQRADCVLSFTATSLVLRRPGRHQASG